MKYRVFETEAEAIIAQEDGCEVETGYCFRECVWSVEKSINEVQSRQEKTINEVQLKQEKTKCSQTQRQRKSRIN